MGKLIIILALSLLMAACTYAPPEESGQIDIFFCPKDDCESAYISLIDGSDDAVCAFYDLELPSLITTIRESKAKVFLEKDNYEKRHRKNDSLYAGVDIRTDRKSSYMHNKFCVINKSIVVTGSFNPTERGKHSNNNNVIIIHSSYLAANYLDEFYELWNYESDQGVLFPAIIFNGNKVENYFCPEDCAPSVYTSLISSANKSVYFMTFSFTHDSIGDALVKAHNRGLDVRGIFEKTQNSRWLEKEKLENAGIDVAWDKNKANMHHKVFIIDENIVITGSTNPSNNGLARNDENILVLHDKRIAREFLDEFYSIII